MASNGDKEMKVGDTVWEVKKDTVRTEVNTCHVCGHVETKGVYAFTVEKKTIKSVLRTVTEDGKPDIFYSMERYSGWHGEFRVAVQGFNLDTDRSFYFTSKKAAEVEAKRRNLEVEETEAELRNLGEGEPTDGP